jgi:hypothetical protein
MTKTILRQLVELGSKDVSDLRQLYNEIMPKKCAANANKEFLWPRIAYRIQELEYGGLTDESKSKLLKIADGVSSDSSKNSSGLLPGTKICREWNGTMYQVEVLKDCFEYQGQKFKSLSSIATKITGTKWNGPKFFKLRAA